MATEKSDLVDKQPVGRNALASSTLNSCSPLPFPFVSINDRFSQYNTCKHSPYPLIVSSGSGSALNTVICVIKLRFYEILTTAGYNV